MEMDSARECRGLDVLMRDAVEWKEEISSDRFSGSRRQRLLPAVVGLSYRDKATIQFGNYGMTCLLPFSLVLMSVSVT